MKTIIIACLGLFVASCATRSTNSTATPSSDSRYPFSEVEKVYDVVLDGMTTKYFSAYPDLDKAHTAKMREFIATEYPRERFLDEMIRDEYRPKLERGMRDQSYRDTKEFKDAFDVVVTVSVQMAKMIIGGQRDIYVAKFVEKTPIKVELFSVAKTEDERQYVSWISGEAEVGAVAKEAGNEYKPQTGDKAFAFCSPEQTWADLCGRQGYLIVRDGKIAQVIVTMMN